MRSDGTGENTATDETPEPGAAPQESPEGMAGPERVTSDLAMDLTPALEELPEGNRQDPPMGEMPPKEEIDALKVVGIGASAGGIEALQAFFENVPADSGFAYVVVMHLSSEHESHLAEVVGRATPMPVSQVTNEVTVKPDHVYVIPPSRHLAMTDGTLRLIQPELPGERSLAIDLFFRALAEAHGPHSIGVVLSGAGEDGSLGLRQIREMGGLTVAQDPTEAEFDSMPRHAIAEGIVDYVLPAAEISRQILTYWDVSGRMRLPEEAAPSPPQVLESPDTKAALAGILDHVRGQTGHDFARYKRATVLRRVGRRLQVNHLEDLPAYLEYLRRHPAEVSALLSDLLISVTHFFRDPEYWQTLELDVIPLLFHGKGPQDEVRVWVCGCSTGEEAYSVTMLLLEYAERHQHSPGLKVFATDMDPDSIAIARTGSYPPTIAADVSRERLRRWFFTDENGRYRVRREVRELVLFAEHDVLRDTPFSRIDLITCRNLLIYLNREAQGNAFETFHFALRPDGRLFLGSAESVDGASPLFTTTDKHRRMYMRRPYARPPMSLPRVPSRGVSRLAEHDAPRLAPAFPTLRDRFLSMGEIHRELLELYAPPSILVSPEHEMLHLSNHAGRFLRFTGGEPSTYLPRLIHPDLRVEVSTALYAAVNGREQVRRARMKPEDGPERTVGITVRSVREGESAYFLVSFEEMPEGDDGEKAASTEEAPPTDTVRELEAEIARLRMQLRHTVDQYEATVEELKAANEEQQASNEELRSATEELETSKEELQSVNEELATLNQELKNRLDELGISNSDLQNLLASTDIGTIFLGQDLKLKRYTPPTEAIFNLIPSDVGRPLSQLTHRLEYPELPGDVEEVLERFGTIDREVSSVEGWWYLARLRPYRTTEDRIEGVVISFVDITVRKRAEDQLKASEERFRLLVDGTRDYAIFMIDLENKIQFWSAGAERIFGWTEAEAVGRGGELIFTPEDRERGEHEKEFRTAITTGRAEDRRWHLRKDGTRLWCEGVSTRLDDKEGRARGASKICRDATRDRQAEEELQEAQRQLEARVEERTASLSEALVARETALAQRQTMEEAQARLMRQLVTAQEEERARISRDLHDRVGQQLTGWLLELKALQGGLGEGGAADQMGRLIDRASNLGREIHTLAWELRPPALDDLGLLTTLSNFTQEWARQSGIPAEFHLSGLEKTQFSSEAATNLYRITQEALNNVVRHSGATRASVLLERRDHHVDLIIEDNGSGFDPDAVLDGPGAARHLGLRGIRERASLMEGTLEIESARGKGSTLFVRVPVGRGGAAD